MEEEKPDLLASISRIVDKIGDEEDRIGWPELANMVAEAYSAAEKETDVKKLFSWEAFFFRLYHRVKTLDYPTGFNFIDKITQRECGKLTEYYKVRHYDHKMFLWCRNKGFFDQITDDWILIPVDKLTDTEKARFDKQLPEKSF